MQSADAVKKQVKQLGEANRRLKAAKRKLANKARVWGNESWEWPCSSGSGPPTPRATETEDETSAPINFDIDKLGC